jgi:cation diffusion facilitator family transporter
MLGEKMNSKICSNNEKKIIRQVTLVGVVGNILLSGFKLFAGIYGHSGAMLSDAVHSLSDVFATIIAFVGVKFAKKAADQEHPYGHERIECVASLILGSILMLTGIGIGYNGFMKILEGNYDELVAPKVIALVAAIVSILTKEGMYWYTRHYAKILDSAAFMADAWHHRSDAISSVGSLVGIGGAIMGYRVMDPLATVVICLIIMKVAYGIIKDSLVKMVDTSCGGAYDKKLEDYVMQEEGVLGVDMLHSRMFGNKVYIDLEIEVEEEMSLKEAHKIAEHVHDNVETNHPEIKHIMIHVNPYTGK